MRTALIRTLRIIAAAIILAISLVPMLAQPRRAMAPADILRMANVGDAQISPNGQWVVYTVTTNEGNETLNTLWLARVNIDLTPSPGSIQQRPTLRPSGSETPWPEAQSTARPLLPNDWNASTPRWSPDNTQIAFLSSRAGLSCVWVVNITKPAPMPYPNASLQSRTQTFSSLTQASLLPGLPIQNVSLTFLRRRNLQQHLSLQIQTSRV